MWAVLSHVVMELSAIRALVPSLQLLDMGAMAQWRMAWSMRGTSVYI